MRRLIRITGPILSAFILVQVCYVFTSCNPMYDDAPGRTWDALHSVKIGGFMHGYNYRFPYGHCDEANCHGPALGGGNTGGPSCTKCHVDLWTVFATHTARYEGAYHHKNVVLDQPYTYCSDAPCHGAALTGGTAAGGYHAGPSCWACHDGPSGDD